MQFSSFLSLVLLSVAVSARTSLKDSCGAGTVISERTFSHNGQDIAVSTTSCPGFAALKSSSASAASRPTKRQSNIGFPCSTFVCELNEPQPNIQDCSSLTTALIDVGSGVEFAAPSNTLTTFTLGDCLYGFGNFDTIEYFPTFSNVGLSGQSFSTRCFSLLSTFTAGLCLSPEVSGNNWRIEIIQP